MVWFGLVRFGVVWLGLVWFGVISWLDFFWFECQKDIKLWYIMFFLTIFLWWVHENEEELWEEFYRVSKFGNMMVVLKATQTERKTWNNGKQIRK